LLLLLFMLLLLLLVGWPADMTDVISSRALSTDRDQHAMSTSIIHLRIWRLRCIIVVLIQEAFAHEASAATAA
jgi:hypothetical protein